MTVEAGELIEKLRTEVLEGLEQAELDEGDVMAVFDRACVKVLVATHNGHGKELTRGQKAAATRAANRAKESEQKPQEVIDGLR